jgi:hypothetical protein
MIYDIMTINDASEGMCKDGEYVLSNVLSTNFPWLTDKTQEI